MVIYLKRNETNTSLTLKSRGRMRKCEQID